MDEALAWARKGAISCDAVGEVRELLILLGSGTRTRRKQVNSPGPPRLRNIRRKGGGWPRQELC